MKLVGKQKNRDWELEEMNLQTPINKKRLGLKQFLASKWSMKRVLIFCVFAVLLESPVQYAAAQETVTSSVENYDHASTVQVLENAEYFTMESAPGSPKVDACFRHFNALVAHATEAEIVALLDSNNPQTRLYALAAYRERFPHVFWDRGLEFLEDCSQVLIYFDGMVGDAGFVNAVGLKVFHWMIGNHTYDAEGYLDTTLSKEKQEIIIQQLTRNEALRVKHGKEPRKMCAANYIFRVWDIPKSFADDVAILAENGNDAALIPLAKWENQAHVPLMRKRFADGDLRYVLKAASLWPDPAFLPVLEQRYKAAEEMGETNKFMNFFSVLNEDYPSFGLEWIQTMIGKTRSRPFP